MKASHKAKAFVAVSVGRLSKAVTRLSLDWTFFCSPVMLMSFARGGSRSTRGGTVREKWR